MRIGQPARRHGVSDEDIRHAIRAAMRRVHMDDEMTMVIGPGADGQLLEVGVLDLYGDAPVVIHAMTLRPTFRRFL